MIDVIFMSALMYAVVLFVHYTYLSVGRSRRNFGTPIEGGTRGLRKVKSHNISSLATVFTRAIFQPGNYWWLIT